MASNRNRTALITGASSGIGYEFARLLARDHFDLILVARSGDRLATIAEELSAADGISVRVIANDLGRPGAAEALFAELDGTAVDVLVNNAGFGLKGAVAELSPEAQEEMVQLNVLALTALTRLFRGPTMDAASVAAAGYAALKRGRAMVIPGAGTREV